MILGFADLLNASATTFSRPIVTKSMKNDDFVVIIGGRHPVISNIANKPHSGNTQSFVPNDCFFSSLDSFQLLTGPNGSGKVLYMQ